MNIHFFHHFFRKKAGSGPQRSAVSHAPLSRITWMILLFFGMAVGTYLQFLVGALPLSFHTFFVLLAGFILGPLYAPITMAVYIGIGALGLPILGVGKGGIGHLMGPTGGYIFGWLFAACLAGIGRMLARRSPLPWAWGITIALIALVPVYMLGLPWLKYTLDITWPRTVARGLIIFLPGEVVKVVLVVWLYRYLEKTGLVAGRRKG